MNFRLIFSTTFHPSIKTVVTEKNVRLFSNSPISAIQLANYYIQTDRNASVIKNVTDTWLRFENVATSVPPPPPTPPASPFISRVPRFFLVAQRRQTFDGEREMVIKSALVPDPWTLPKIHSGNHRSRRMAAYFWEHRLNMRIRDYN